MNTEHFILNLHKRKNLQLKITQVATYLTIASRGSVRIDKSEPLPALSIRQEHRWQLRLKIGRPIFISQLEDIEVKTKTKFPDPVKWFYQSCNGFEIVDPPLRVKSLSELTRYLHG